MIMNQIQIESKRMIFLEKMIQLLMNWMNCKWRKDVNEVFVTYMIPSSDWGARSPFESNTIWPLVSTSSWPEPLPWPLPWPEPLPWPVPLPWPRTTSLTSNTSGLHLNQWFFHIFLDPRFVRRNCLQVTFQLEFIRFQFWYFLLVPFDIGNKSSEIRFKSCSCCLIHMFLTLMFIHQFCIFDSKWSQIIHNWSHRVSFGTYFFVQFLYCFS